MPFTSYSSSQTAHRLPGGLRADAEMPVRSPPLPDVPTSLPPQTTLSWAIPARTVGSRLGGGVLLVKASGKSGADGHIDEGG